MKIESLLGRTVSAEAAWAIDAGVILFVICMIGIPMFIYWSKGSKVSLFLMILNPIAMGLVMVAISAFHFHNMSDVTNWLVITFVLGFGVSVCAWGIVSNRRTKQEIKELKEELNID